MHERTLTALFENRADAERAAERLKAAGFDKDVEIHDQAGADRAEAGGHGGFMDTLRRMFGGHPDAHAYGEGLRRGHFLLTARVSEQSETRAAEILEASSAVDLDRTTQGWRDEGWTDVQPMGERTTVGAVGDTFASTTPVADAAFARELASDADLVSGSDRGVSDRAADDVGIAENRREQGGKRQDGREGARVRTYVVGMPLDEQVGLRDARVSAEQGAVGRPVPEADAAFQDRTIERTETAEEAVIAEQAFVRDDPLLRTETGERVETIHDTPRRTEAQVGDATGVARDAGTRPV